MTTLETVKRRLDHQCESAAAHHARKWLDGHQVEPIAQEPAKITVAEALHLWRTRLAVSRETKHKINGLPELVERLDALTHHKKVDQFAFLGSTVAATFLFERSSGSYIGAAFVDKIPAPKQR